MIYQQVTLSGDAEWPKVADAVIEAGNWKVAVNHGYRYLGDVDRELEAQEESLLASKKVGF
jgi:hypothetical protein